MNRVYVLGLVCAALAAGTGSKAQSVSGRIRSSEKSSPDVRLAGARKAAAARVHHLRSLDREAILELRAAEHVAQREGVSGPEVRQYAYRAQEKLQEVMDDLNAAPVGGTHLAKIRAHQKAALAYTGGLMAETAPRDLNTTSISSLARLAINNAHAAEELLRPSLVVDEWIKP